VWAQTLSQQHIRCDQLSMAAVEHRKRRSRLHTNRLQQAHRHDDSTLCAYSCLSDQSHKEQHLYRGSAPLFPPFGKTPRGFPLRYAHACRQCSGTIRLGDCEALIGSADRHREHRRPWETTQANTALVRIQRHKIPLDRLPDATRHLEANLFDN
jgi:hypothetical protein